MEKKRVSKLDNGDVFDLDGGILLMSTGGRVCHPCITAPWPSSCHLLGRNHYFSKGAVGLFVWCGPGVLYIAMRENVEGKVECVCVRVCALPCVWHGRGYTSQRAVGPDVWLPLTVHSRGCWSGEGPAPSLPFPGTKARAQLIDVNSVAFVPKAQRHAEWEIWPLLRVRLCFWTPLAFFGRSGQRVSEQMRGKTAGKGRSQLVEFTGGAGRVWLRRRSGT